MENKRKSFKIKIYPVVLTIYAVCVALMSSCLIVFRPVETTKNFLSAEILQKYDFSDYENLMIVAHPDDESIWGGAELLKEDYVVLCLTNKTNERRAEEFYKAMSVTGDLGIMLPYPDLDYSLIQNKWVGAEEFLTKDVKMMLEAKEWDKIVTHNPEGEYGHRHHIITNKVVTLCTKDLDDFGRLFYFTEYMEQDEIKDAKKMINGETLEKKQALVDIYRTTQNHSVKTFWHMLVFEELILASAWIK